MTIASETIIGTIKDGPKRERTFLDEDQSSKRKPVRKYKVCKGPHSLWNCEGFKRLAVRNRWNSAKEHKLSFRCLSDGQRGDTCSWNKFCGINGCHSHHHRMLHEDHVARVETQAEVGVESSSASTSSCTREGEIS